MELPDFSDKDTWAQLEHLAYDRNLDVRQFPPAEYKYFSELSNVYAVYKLGFKSQEDAKREKRQLLREYDENVKALIVAKNAFRDWQAAVKKSEFYRAEIAKTDDKDKKLSLCLQCIKAIIGDQTL